MARSRASNWQAALLGAAVVCTLGVLLPPAGTAVARQAWVEAVQYSVLAMVGPALLVLSAPWRLLARSDPAGTSLADRLVRSRSRRGRGLAPWGFLVAFVVAAIVWRLPPVVDALARHPVLVLAELATLFPAGCGLWLELVTSPPLLPRITRPQRAVFAAVAMWTIWVLAYIMGFSHAWFAAYAHATGSGPSPADDEQVAAGILWAVPALCFTPVVFSSMLGWLNDSADPDEELRSVTAAGHDAAPGQLTPPPPRGWRTRPARR
jgi:cytochrome c oxidase assembly factor CtaG